MRRNVYLVDTNLPEERVQVLVSQIELTVLLDNSPNNFEKSKVDCYMERPRATFYNGKYSVLNDFCYAE